jgi:hypothetical protein
MKKINFIILFLLFFILCGTNILKAATLTVGSNSGAPGDLNISIPVSLTSDPGDDVDAFSLDLNFDALRLMFNGVTPGASTIAASKLIAYSMPSNNKLRLIVYGFNHNIINSGTVLNFSFNIRATAPSGTAAITITNEILVDIDKNTVSSTIVNGNILVQGSIDMDNDGISDVQDNCPEIPNGPDLGTCTAGANISQECTNNSSCGTGGFCSMNQEDTDGNGQGDACQSIPCSISITGLDLPGRRNIPVTCGKTKLLSPCFVDGDCNTP